MMSVMTACFPAPITPEQYCNKPDFYRLATSNAGALSQELHRHIALHRDIGDVNYIFYTRPGPGPLQVKDESLLDSNGFPISPSPKHNKLVIPSRKDASKKFVPMDSPFPNHRHGYWHNALGGDKCNPNLICYHAAYAMAAVAFAVGAGLAVGIARSRR